MNLVKNLLVILIILLMIATLITTSAGMTNASLILIFLYLMTFFIVFAIQFAADRKNKYQLKVTEERLEAAPVRSFPAKIVRMHRKEEESFDYYITFEAPDGSQKELAVDENTYNLYNPGNTGNLVYLHGFCFSFTPMNCPQPTVYPRNAQFLTAKIVHKRKKRSPHSCFITFETPETGWEVRVSPYLFETCCEGETGDLICRNGTFLGFEQAAEEILDPALFERNIPQQEPDGNRQMNGL